PQAAERVVAIADGEFAFLDELREARANLRLGTIEHRTRNVHQTHIEAGLRKDLRNAVPHRPRTNDTDRSYLHVLSRRAREDRRALFFSEPDVHRNGESKR